MNHPDLADLQIFFGRLTENAAAVYATLPKATGWSDDLQLVGEVTGPLCEGSRTLPATVPLQYSGAEPTPLAAATVPDPTFWSPALPARYEVAVQITKGQEVLTQRKRRLALRRFGAQGRSFVDQGRRVVVRGACARSVLAKHGAEDWYEQRLHFLLGVDSQTDIVDLAQQLDLAERTGFPLVASVATQDRSVLRRQLGLLGSCGAVSLVIIERDGVSSFGAEGLPELARSLPNLRLAAEVQADQQLCCPKWSIALVVRIADEAPANLALDNVTCPIVLRRSLDTKAMPMDLLSKRRLCEQLQREFTTAGDFAGYLIG